MDLAELLLNPWLFLYVAIVVLTQVAVAVAFEFRRRRLDARRASLGLGGVSLGDQDQHLRGQRREAFWLAGALLGTVFVVPLLLKTVPGMTLEEKQGLAVGFGLLLLWVLLTGTDVSRAMLGGLAFRTAAALHRPFQVGDRVVLRGVAGRVEEFGMLFTKIRTPDDNLVSLPTGSLWSEVLSSANAGERASLAVIVVYLAPHATRPEREAAEEALRQSVIASAYVDLHKPVQIRWQQEPTALQLSAWAYAASTYNERAFVSDVTRTFLDLANDALLPLACPHIIAFEKTRQRSRALPEMV